MIVVVVVVVIIIIVVVVVVVVVVVCGCYCYVRSIRFSVFRDLEPLCFGPDKEFTSQKTQPLITRYLIPSFYFNSSKNHFPPSSPSPSPFPLPHPLFPIFKGFHSGVFWAIFQVNTFGNLVAQLVENTCTDHADAYLFVGLTGMAIIGVIFLGFLPKAPTKELSETGDMELEREREAEEPGPFDVSFF